MAKTQKRGNNKRQVKKAGKRGRNNRRRTQKGGGVYGFLPELTGSPNAMRHYPNISQETCNFDPLSVGVLRPNPLQMPLQAGGSRGYSVNTVFDPLFQGTYGQVTPYDSGECDCGTSTFDNYSSPLVGGKKAKKAKKAKKDKKGKSGKTKGRKTKGNKGKGKKRH
jgi:hypothetical protein